MMTDAERQRRSRRHKRGDHSLCDPQRRCWAATHVEVNAAVAAGKLAPDGNLGLRGQNLRAALADVDLSPLHRVLVDEAVRISDRLDRLDAALKSKKLWMRFDVADGGEVVVVVDGILAEARQQASALKAIVTELRQAVDGAAKTVKREGDGALADFLAHAARRRSPAG